MFPERGKLVLKQTGMGIDALKNALPDDGCAFALLTLRMELQGVPDQHRNIFIQWKGPSCSGMKKVQASQLVQDALEALKPNHGQLEAIGKTEFNEKTIAYKWQPSAGSHVIE